MLDKFLFQTNIKKHTISFPYLTLKKYTITFPYLYRVKILKKFQKAKITNNLTLFKDLIGYSCSIRCQEDLRS